jgi:flagellar protein FlgJ
MNTLDSIMPLNPESTDLQRFASAGKKTPENLAAIKKLSDEFEAIFLEIVLKSMRETVDKSKLTDGGNGEQIFQSMLDSEYAKNLANQRTSGLAESIEKHLIGMMPENNKAKSVQEAAGRAQYHKAATEFERR